MYIIEFFMPWVMSVLGMMIIIPYYTMAERKVLSYIQLRKGPNKVSIVGILNPIADGMKLMFKEFSMPLGSSWFVFGLSPLFKFFFMLGTLVILSSSKFFFYGLLFYFVLVSLNVYSVLGSAWASKSKYCMLSSMRMMGQVVSYEIGLFTLGLMVMFFSSSADLSNMSIEESHNFGIMLSILWLGFFIMESNRTPFDFAEGESELVNGYSTEYASFMFAFLSMAEYGSMAVSSLVMGSLIVSKIWISLLMSCFIMFCFMWIRGTLPRFRYDLLMGGGWFWGLPLVFLIFFSVLM